MQLELNLHIQFENSSVFELDDVANGFCLHSFALPGDASTGDETEKPTERRPDSSAMESDTAVAGPAETPHHTERTAFAGATGQPMIPQRTEQPRVNAKAAFPSRYTVQAAQPTMAEERSQPESIPAPVEPRNEIGSATEATEMELDRNVEVSRWPPLHP
eukprot:scaffold528614_cov52-Prasinocladus_malaysianus.AAC.1